MFSPDYLPLYLVAAYAAIGVAVWAFVKGGPNG
jgi:hypothetical protein